MIEVVSWPLNLDDWTPDHQVLHESASSTSSLSKEFYLELYGETSPVVDATYAQVLPSGPPDDAHQSAQGAPIYEYWWTIGHTGASAHHGHLWEHSDDSPSTETLWHDLNDVAARLYLFFPISAGWRVKELVATVKYLTPIHNQVSLTEKAHKTWAAASPLVGDVGHVAGALTPIAGPAAVGASALLSALAKVQINSVPQADGFEWSTAKVASKIEGALMHGIMWTLPKKMFVELGSRLTGSVALSFIQAGTQQAESGGGSDPAHSRVLAPSSIKAHAVVYGKKDTVWVPDMRHFIELRIAPVLPS